MDRRSLDTLLLFAIAILLGITALRPLWTPEVTHAQGPAAMPFYIEPGTTMLRSPDGTSQVQGKVVVDLRNGNIWGFPTLSSAPYPVDATSSQPPVSHPMYLGRFDFAKAAAGR